MSLINAILLMFCFTILWICFGILIGLGIIITYAVVQILVEWIDL